MKAAIKLFLVLITIVVILFSWISGQLGNPNIQLLIAVLIATSVGAFFLMNLLDARELRKARERREAGSESGGGQDPGSPVNHQKRSDTSFTLKERKSGLTWGGGNIKASEATRGTKRKFLGRS